MVINYINPYMESRKLCRICRTTGDHWTSKCPQKTLPSTTTNIANTANATNTQRRSIRSRDKNGIRVSNLSYNTSTSDLYDLFSSFGPITRTHIAYDRDTHKSRGFGFIIFESYENKISAINEMNVNNHHNSILNVEPINHRI